MWAPPPPASPEALAIQACDHGEQALRDGDHEAAIRWLDRAHRLAPRDGTLTLALAAACLQRDPPRAAALFRAVAVVDDVRNAWLGLALACLQSGDPAGAADALGHVLARHAPEASLLGGGTTLADAITRAAGAPGWCGLTSEGEVILRPVAPGTPLIQLDDVPCRGTGLPRHWSRARTITATLGGRPLLGSPIQVQAILRLSGFVAAHDGGLRGWAWHPGDPDRTPHLLISGQEGGKTLRITAADDTVAVPYLPALAQPRGFEVPAASLLGLRPPLQVAGLDGTPLLGSPLDPDREQREAAAAAAGLAVGLTGRKGTVQAFAPPALPADLAVHPHCAGVSRRRPNIAVVIPVFGNIVATLACLDSVQDTVAAPHRIIVVDDASPEPALRTALDRLAAAGRIRLLRHQRNRGFPVSARAGTDAAAGLDVVLLNSDTLVPAGWLERLREAAYSAPGIGSVTPFSNNASILSYPGAPDGSPAPDLATTRRLDAAAQRANRGGTVEIPVGVGFCLYLRRDCLDAVGPLRTDVFAQGYGEENDFCLRARRLGWRHLAATGVFVAHVGGASFGQPAYHLRQRNEVLLQRLHPGYDRLIAAFGAADPLAEARRRMDLVRWRAEKHGTAGAAILITHDDGGGVETRIGVSAAAHRAAGLRPIVLRPERRPGAEALVVVDGAKAGFPNLRYDLPREMPALLRLLSSASPRLAEIHHTLHHNPAIYDLVVRLGVPYEVVVHDYIWFCPRVSLVGLERRYCGEPGPVQCEACVADAGRIIDDPISVQDLRDRSAAVLAAARRIVVPSADAATRMRKHFPGLDVTVVPEGDDGAVPEPPAPQARNGWCRVCLLGAIGVHKGYDILLACARDAAARDLPLDFVVVGHTIDDGRLLATGRVFITGRYEPGEADALIRAQHASLALFASICPETWSLALTELWHAGLRVAAFDIGAPAERIRATGRGFVMPLGLPPRGINNALVAAAGLTGHVSIRNVAQPVRHATASKSPSINHGTNATTAGRAHV